MISNKKKITFLFLIILILSSSSMLLSQFEPESNNTKEYQVEEKSSKSNDDIFGIFEPVPKSYWIKINSFGTISIVIVVIAFILGFVIMFIGINAGGRQNKRLIRSCVAFAVFIAVFARPICNLAHYWLTKGLDSILPLKYASAIAGFLIYVLWITYLAYSAILMYESFVVTAKEAHPM